MGDKAIRKIIFYGNEFWTLYNKQTKKVQDRINWTLGVVRDIERIPEKYFKHIEGTKLYEVRISSGNNIFRIFCFFDKGKLVVVINGFQKKSQKTPRKEIERALKLQKQYYDEQKK
jgi:phage-related protein